MADGADIFTVEPWAVRETELHPDLLGRVESVFALSNGHIGMRANLDEGEPHGLPGSYLNGFYEQRPLPYAESAYGNPETSQTVVNVTNAKIIRLLVDDEPFDVRYGDLLRHERTLDLRAGYLTREAEWRSPSGNAVRIRSTRLVSFVHRGAAMICYEVEPLEDDLARVVVQSELVANEPLPGHSADPRVAAALTDPLRSESADHRDLRATLTHSTKASELRLAAAMDHEVEGPDDLECTSEAAGDLARVTVTTNLRPGQRLRIVKYIAYGWSSQRSMPAVRGQVDAALTQAMHHGWDQLVAAQRAYLDDFWDRGDVQIDGDAELQQAIRFALFHVLQAGARAERRAIPAKGLTGPGYDGHAFWDTETFVLPTLSYTSPDAVADALRWRCSTLPEALARAEQLGLRGAAFPWRTISGSECSGYWPAGTAAFHVNADIADAAVRYVNVTGDEDFEREIGLPLLVQTARLWRSLGHHDIHGAFRIDGVTGPDEYSAIADNNVYTNLMARANLLAAVDVVRRHRQLAAAMEVDPEEAAGWADAAGAIVIPYDEELGVHEQSEGFTRHEQWDFSAERAANGPLLLQVPYFDLYRKQVVKQADLVLALHLCGDAFTPEEKARNFAYYEPLTVRDSSLSACTQAIVAAEVGHIELAYDYLGEAALMDLDDLEHNTGDGVHIASLAGAWLAVVAGLGGLRDHDGQLHFSPRLPEALPRVEFHLAYRGRRLTVEIRPEEATYLLHAGDELSLTHHGEPVQLDHDEPVTLPIPAIDPGPAPEQPPGHAPMRRRPPH